MTDEQLAKRLSVQSHFNYLETCLNKYLDGQVDAEWFAGEVEAIIELSRENENWWTSK